MKKRTEERLELSQAKANYWKWHRGDGRAESKDDGAEGKREVWNRLRGEISALEEDG